MGRAARAKAKLLYQLDEIKERRGKKKPEKGVGNEEGRGLLANDYLFEGTVCSSLRPLNL